jgi:hypothetical protein
MGPIYFGICFVISKEVRSWLSPRNIEFRPTWFRAGFMLDEVIMKQESLKRFFDLYRPFVLCSTISVPCGERQIQPGSTLSHLWVFKVVSLFPFGHFVIYKKGS